MRGYRGWLVVTVAIVAMNWRAGAAEPAWTTLTVRVYDNADVPKAAVRTALEVAAHTLRPADLDVTWLQCSASSGGRCTLSLGRGEFMVRLVRSSTEAGREDEPLGTALIDPASGTGVLATVYVDRVERMTRGSNGDLGTLLGRAMAHEIGHLLMGRTAHATAGLMRPRWTRAEVARNARPDWGLAAGDLRVIRARRGM
jgi:hypothetical protein